MIKTTLHIVDGDSTGGTLGQSSLRREGEILSWRDALYSGPVPEGLSLRQLSRIRSRFWTNGRSTAEFTRRDSDLARYGDYDEVVLWFGSGCTLCELSLIQLLSWFGEQRTLPVRLSWVREHGGILNVEQIVQAYSARHLVKQPQIRLAAKAWSAFRSPSPGGLNQLYKRRLQALPGLRKAIGWLLREYPAVRGGLSRLQRKLLREISSRGEAKVSVVVAAVLKAESVGDTFLSDLLERCVQVEHPLVSVEHPEHTSSRRRLQPQSLIALTDIARRVLRGKVDHVELNGVDYWIGGVHLSGNQVPWRWDGRRIVPVKGSKVNA